MLTPDETISLQAERHGLLTDAQFESVEDYCLYLMHKKSYQFAAEHVTGQRVLDLGCNTGYGTQILATQAASVTGLDVSRDAVAYAKREHGGANITYAHTDGSQLPFEAEQLDAVVSLQVVEHVADTARYCSEITRVLGAPGTALFTTPNAALRLDPGMPPWNIYHVREYRPAELRELMLTWFEDVEVLGLFADDAFGQVELRRIARARRNARKRVRAAVSRFIRRRISQDTIWAARRWLQSRQSPRQHVDLEAFSCDQLSYRSDNLDNAIDLLALCRTPRPSARRIKHP